MGERIATSSKLDPAAALLWHPPGNKIALLDEFPFPRLRSPILDATLACRQSFRGICFARHNKSKWAEENLISFNAWSVSSGAGVWGEFSLDDKLVTRRQDSCIVRNLLWMLDDFVSAVGRIGKQLFILTENFLRSLPFPRLWDSESSFGDEVDEDLLSFKSTLVSEYEPLRANAEQGRVQSITVIRDRLVEANSKRRRRLQNARKRKVESRSGASTQRQGPYPVLPPPVATGSKVFECPHCFENLPVYLARAGHWREHAKRLDKVHAAALKLGDAAISSETASWQIDKPLECPFCPELDLRDRSLDHIANCLFGFAMKALLYNDTDIHSAPKGVSGAPIELSDAVDSAVLNLPVENIPGSIDLICTEGQPVPDRPQTISPSNLPKTQTKSKQSPTSRLPERGDHRGRRSPARTRQPRTLPNASQEALVQGSALSTDPAVSSDGPPAKRRKLSDDDRDTRTSNASSVFATIDGSGVSGSNGRKMASGNNSIRSKWVDAWNFEKLPFKRWEFFQTGQRHQETGPFYDMDLCEIFEKLVHNN
ncbi:transcription factor Zn C2H2 [Fusarium pseudoanthophilum]|uniref:Transcription factor Zn C2H2 n=1 Tax=Fusarium pseudoanthophilum TaxID=48495 RepID=A0A8H5UKK7_9HYPO|nr:transcription factor Zn C2H2 [Fusarium pseudoanthophilum]